MAPTANLPILPGAGVNHGRYCASYSQGKPREAATPAGDAGPGEGPIMFALMSPVEINAPPPESIF